MRSSQLISYYLFVMVLHLAVNIYTLVEPSVLLHLFPYLGSLAETFTIAAWIGAFFVAPVGIVGSLTYKRKRSLGRRLILLSLGGLIASGIVLYGLLVHLHVDLTSTVPLVTLIVFAPSVLLGFKLATR